MFLIDESGEVHDINVFAGKLTQIAMIIFSQRRENMTENESKEIVTVGLDGMRYFVRKDRHAEAVEIVRRYKEGILSAKQANKVLCELGPRS